MSKNKDMVAIKVGVNYGKLMRGIAEAVDIDMRDKLTLETEHLFSKGATIGACVLEQIVNCIKETIDDEKNCLRFAIELGVIPKPKKKDVAFNVLDSKEADEKLKELMEDKDAPQEVKDFMKGIVSLAKAIQKKKDSERKDD